MKSGEGRTGGQGLMGPSWGQSRGDVNFSLYSDLGSNPSLGSNLPRDPGHGVPPPQKVNHQSVPGQRTGSELGFGCSWLESQYSGAR